MFPTTAAGKPPHTPQLPKTRKPRRPGTVALTDPTSITAEMTVHDMATDSPLRCSSYRFKRRSEALEDHEGPCRRSTQQCL